MSQSLETKTPEVSEIDQVQNAVEKIDSRKAKIVLVVQSCHLCSPRKVPLNPVTMKIKSGVTISFCNNEEMQTWKKQKGFD